MRIEPGMTGEAHTTVTTALTAAELGSGDLPVYGTPAMIALMEEAAVAALAPHLSAAETSVGVGLEVVHLAATPLGHQVRAEAEVTEVDGRRVTFQVRAWDESEMIGEGSHTRFVVDRERFMGRVRTK